MEVIIQNQNSMETKNGNESAFPFRDNYESSENFNSGMSKRFYAACAAMNGFLSGVNSDKEMSNKLASAAKENKVTLKKYIAEISFGMADEMIKQELISNNK